jgi:hypothetical protein
MTIQSAIAAVILICMVGDAAGCFPATFAMVPDIKGRVIDQSGQPVPTATVHIANTRNVGGYRVDTTVSCDASGKFYRKERARWGMYIVPMDLFATQLEAIARDESRQSARREFYGPVTMRPFGLIGSRAVVDLGDLTLNQPATVP